MVQHLPLLAVLAAAAAPLSQSFPPAAPWAELTVSGLGINPVQETWRFGFSAGGAVYVVRTTGSKTASAVSISLTSSTTCPGLMARLRELPRKPPATSSAIPPPTDGLDYRLEVISKRTLAGVRGPLRLTGDDFSPLAAWTRNLARTIDRCSRPSRRGAVGPGP